MKAFYYRLVTPNGHVRTGILRLSVERDFSARLWLEKNYQGVVVSLYRIPQWAGTLFAGSSAFFKGKIQPDELAGLLRDLGVMTGAGVPMLSALDALVEENESTEQKRIAHVAKALSDDLDAGANVATAFGKHPEIFPETVLNMINIGHETGTIDKMLIEASKHVERIGRMGRDARRAMIYPIFVLVALFIVSCVWIFYVIPNLGELYKQMNIKLPAVTKAILGFSELVTANVGLTLFIVAAIIIVPWVAFRLSWRFRKKLHGLGHRLPISKTLMRASGMAFITEHLSILIAAGLDMVKSLEVLSRSIRDEVYRARIIDLLKVVKRGERLAAAMKQVGGFPAMAVRMISVGEDTGTLDKQLAHLAREYRYRFDHLIDSLAEVLKPAIIIILGVMFIIFVVAMYLPIYDLIKQAMAPASY